MEARVAPVVEAREALQARGALDLAVDNDVADGGRPEPCFRVGDPLGDDRHGVGVVD